MKMSKKNLLKCSMVSLLCLLVAASECFSMASDYKPRKKYERTVQVSAPMQADNLFKAQTHNGYINVTGADVNQCGLTAAITAQAETVEDAQRIAEAVEIKLIPSDSGLATKIEKPRLARGESIGVNLDAVVPIQTSIDILSRNGALTIKNLTGQLNGITHNGKVVVEKISGTTKLKTHNGEITCKGISGNTELKTHNGQLNCEEVSGDIKLLTHNGSVKVLYSPTALPVCDISIVTYNNWINLTTPPNLSAKVEAETHNGSVNTDLPVTVIGKVSKKKLTGTIGTGEGKLYLETYNGSIKIK
jgi:hypothetical protein